MEFSNPLTPLELIASKYRTSDHDLQRGLRTVIRNLLKFKSEEGKDSDSFRTLLHEGKQELMALKRKLSATSEQQSRLYDVCRKRIHRHEQLSKQSNGEREQFQFKAELIQYLHSRKELGKARQLQQTLKEQPMFCVETELLREMEAISASIGRNELEPLKRWMYENGHMVDKLESCLPFDLMCCDFVNLVNRGTLNQACALIRNQIKTMRLTSQQKHTVQTLTIFLAISDIHAPQIAQYLKGLDIVFRKAFTESYCLSCESLLQRHLAIGISALKTACCCKSEDKREKLICPICAGSTNVLSGRIPMLTKQASILKCRINHSIMDEVNYPVALPNGQIYSLTGIGQTEVGGCYVCPLTGQVYTKTEAKKVFLA